MKHNENWRKLKSSTHGIKLVGAATAVLPSPQAQREGAKIWTMRRKFGLASPELRDFPDQERTASE